MTNEDSCKSVWNTVFDCGISWTSSQFKSACPPKKKKGEEEEEEHARKARSLDEDKGSTDSSTEEKPCTPPCQIYPTLQSCYIKMQDPCAPCCCETKERLPPCPPKRGPQEPREPICGCELCQKNPYNDKCCDKNRAFRGINIAEEYFQKA